MAEQRPGGEPTEPPSEKRLKDARARGEVPRSRELTSAIGFLGVSALLLWFWPAMLAELRHLLSRSLQLAPARSLSPTAALHLGLESLTGAALPLLLGALLLALLGGLVQHGPVFSGHPLRPSLGRLDPLRNARNIFGRAALFELLKTVAKAVGIGAVAALTLRDQLPNILATTGAAPEVMLRVVGSALLSLAVRVGILVVALAAADLLYQRYAFRKRLRMTRVEVQREQREAEGDPRHKAERQRLHREILEHQMLERVASADCIVVNPVRLAVALRYDEGAMGAPRVVARGQRLLAARIRDIARQRGIPIIRDVPLARALVDLELDQEIPPDLYQAVAEVLRFIYRLSGRTTE